MPYQIEHGREGNCRKRARSAEIHEILRVIVEFLRDECDENRVANPEDVQQREEAEQRRMYKRDCPPRTAVHETPHTALLRRQHTRKYMHMYVRCTFTSKTRAIRSLPFPRRRLRLFTAAHVVSRRRVTQYDTTTSSLSLSAFSFTHIHTQEQDEYVESTS